MSEEDDSIKPFEDLGSVPHIDGGLNHAEASGTEEATQALGEAVVGEHSTQIPVTDGENSPPIAINVKPQEEVEHIAGVNASDGDPAYVDPDSPSTVHDINTAYELAEAGHEGRSRAAKERGLIRKLEGHKDEYREVKDDPRFLEERGVFRKRTEVSKWGEESLRDLETKGSVSWLGHDLDPTYGTRAAKLAREEVDSGELNEVLERRRQRVLERARRLDEDAERMEEWAEILHDNPVSDDYRAAHPDFSFGPRSMVMLEYLVKGDEEERAMGFMTESEARFDNPENRRLYSISQALYDDIRGLPTREEGKNWQGLKPEEVDADKFIKELRSLETSGSTTLNDLIDLHKRIVQATMSALQRHAEERKTVLEDVKNGRASRPPEPSAPEQVAA